MAKQLPIEIFMPPNMLKAKVGGSGAGIDMAAIARAEQAMEGLKTEFADWIADGVRELTDARDAFVAAASETTQAKLHRVAHDLKGQALTFGYPLAARVAASLSRLLEGGNPAAQTQLIGAHVEAIRVIVRDNVKQNAPQVAAVLAAELEARVTEVLPEKKNQA
jgi:HPt (histidine-containing phosphotransfer) domain-containing protein